MKKLILAALAVGSIATAQAQRAGSILVYGNIGVSRHVTTTDDGVLGTPDVDNIDFGFNFIPGIGYQFNKNWTAGMNLGIMYNRTNTDPQTLETRERQFAIGPFIRHTMPINKTFFVYHQFNLAYLDGKKTTDNPSPAFDPVYDSYGVFANILPAVGVNFTKCMALNFSMGGLQYVWQRESNNTNPIETTTSNFDFTFGRQFSIGISANLGGKRTYGKRDPGMEHRRHMDMDDDDDVEIKVRRKKVSAEEED